MPLKVNTTNLYIKGDYNMNITGICPYETPCGWCSKWDKKCDNKIGCDATSVEPVRKRAESNEGLSCYKCRHYDSISSVCSDCHPIFKNFEAKEY